ncbi:MAG: hypothetical protein IBJ18_09490 [Phycisphaerales bacterium]|nr:hypothetical protein [Phycisphaerales bacterium]
MKLLWRRASCLVVLALVHLGTFAPCALAQAGASITGGASTTPNGSASQLGGGVQAEPPVRPVLPQAKEPGWDLRDTVNIKETRLFAKLWWDYRDTGLMSEQLKAFRFTNPMPSGLTAFYQTDQLFERVFAHRLFDKAEKLYTLDDLLGDDADVAKLYRTYSITGELTLTSQYDPTAFENYSKLVNSAGQCSSPVDFVGESSTSQSATSLKTTGLVYVGVSCPDPVVGTLPTGDEITATIKRNLPGPVTVPGDPFYWPDGKVPCGTNPDGTVKYCDSPGHPGFDCDDFARAWLAWLKKQLKPFYPDAEYYFLSVYWIGPDGKPHAHAVCLILIDGNWYIVDPQSGEIYGPIEKRSWYDPRREDFGPSLEDLLKKWYGTPNPKDIDWKRRPPDWINPNDVQPWYTDPDVKEWFKRHMPPGTNPDDFIWV